MRTRAGARDARLHEPRPPGRAVAPATPLVLLVLLLEVELLVQLLDGLLVGRAHLAFAVLGVELFLYFFT